MGKNLLIATCVFVGFTLLAGCLGSAANQDANVASQSISEAAADSTASSEGPASAEQTASPLLTLSPSPSIAIEPTPTLTPTYRRNETFVLRAGTVPATPTSAEATTTSTEGTGFTIAFIDVGQGDATLVIASNGETLLIDGGRSKERIRDRLERLGVNDIDAPGLRPRTRMPTT